MSKNIMKEITQLTDNDFFTIFSRIKTDFDFPLHFHDEFELNLIINGQGAKRVVGNNEEVIGDFELVLIGPNLYHAWYTHQCKSRDISEVTIQFHKDLFTEKFLNKTPLSLIKQMFENSKRGILFSRETTMHMAKRIANLNKIGGFYSAFELLSLLYDLSTAKNIKILSDPGHLIENYNRTNEKIEKVFEYLNINFNRQITANEIAAIIGMTETTFSRFVKKHTGNSFINILNEIRIGQASKMLINSTDTISEIAYQCGFNNLSYFNRIFKEKKNLGPKQYRKGYMGISFF